MTKRMYLGSFVASLILLVAAAVVAQPSSQHNLVRTARDLNNQAQRACMFPAGGWTTIDCSNAAAATSAQLNAWSRYVIQCGDDSYFATGDDATDSADSSDGYIPEGSWLEVLTTDTVRYMSCLNVTTDSDCRYIECR